MVLLAGDLFDGDWRDYSTGLYFAAQMSRLRQAGIVVALVRGNHDAASQLTRHLSLPDNVHELPSRKPATVVFEELGIAVHGQSFATRRVTADLAKDYPAPVPELLNIGLLHTSLTGRPEHEPYAPCSLETLVERGYDYWALGHVHAREVVCRDPWVVFPGNLQGRHAREAGDKGATLIAVEDGRVLDVEHRPLDVVRFCVCEVDVGELQTAEDVVDRVREQLQQQAEAAEERVVAARIRVVGQSSAHGPLSRDPERWVAELRAAANAVASTHVWVEKIELHTRAPMDPVQLRACDDALGHLLSSLAEVERGGQALQGLQDELDGLRRKLPAEAREGPDGVRLDDPEYIAQALEHVEQQLLARLLPERGTE